MAREASITQEQVNFAAESIRATGLRPTSRAIRESLGGGSMATVLKLLQVWQGTQAGIQESSIALPVSVQKLLVDYIEQEVAGAKVGLRAELVAVQQANGDLIAESERQASTINLQAEALESMQTDNAGLAGKLTQVESELSRHELAGATERKAAEAARTELAKAHLRLEALPRIEVELSRLRAELDSEGAARIASERSAAVALAKLDAMADRATKAEAVIEKTEKQAQLFQEELYKSRTQIQAQFSALETAGREIDDLRKQANDAREDARRSSEAAAELRGKLFVAKYRPRHLNVKDEKKLAVESTTM